MATSTGDDLVIATVLVAGFILFARATTRLLVALGLLELAAAPGVVRVIGRGIRPTDDYGRRPFWRLAVELPSFAFVTSAFIYALLPSSPYGALERTLLSAFIVSELVWCGLLAAAVLRQRRS